MTRKLVRVAVFAAAVAAVVGSTVGLNAQDKKTYSIKEIMKKGHGAKGLLKGLDSEIKEGKWDDAKTDAALLKEFGEALGSIKPEKGSEESWKKLTAKYKEQTAAVYEAVEKKDAKAASANLAKVADKKASCGACHSAHKP